MSKSQQPSHRSELFGRTAANYDFFVDLITLGHYARFLKRAVEILAPQKGERILELCSGTGRAASWMARAVGNEGEVVAIDAASSMVDVARKRYGAVKNLDVRLGDVTGPWYLQGFFDGIFMAFSLHELPEADRQDVLKRSNFSLKEKGRMVIADFNPGVPGGRKRFLTSLFRLFERENVSYLSFNQRAALERAGFEEVESRTFYFSLLQIALAQKGGAGLLLRPAF